MMQKKHLMLGAGLFLMILIATITGETLTMTVSPFYILGFFFILLGWAGTILIDAWRGQTAQAISNRGHVSIRQRDIITIPWQEAETEESEKKISLGTITIMLTGGFDVGLPWGISWPGPVEAPVYIFPSNYHEKEQHDFHIMANLMIYDLKELPSYIREELNGLNQLTESKNRIHPTKTPIWYATTSHVDGSSTPENLMIERERKHGNRELTESEERQERLYKAMRKQSESTKKELVFAKSVKQIDDEE